MKITICLKSLLFLLIFTLILSCASRKDVVYFQNVNDFETLVSEDLSSTKFKVDDVISIHVSTLNPEASLPFNLFKGAEEGGITPEQVNYIIDGNGEIDFPVIGKIKLIDLSPEETKLLMVEKLSPYLINPIVNIRLKNFSVTILGEVNRPGNYPVNGEQITLLEALGLANDLTIKGRRDNVMVIRDFNGTKVIYHLDLTDKNIFTSPAYYLTQNDVIYVEPNESAITGSQSDTRTSSYISIASIIITSAVIILTR